jgi:hypothetical protein
MKWAIAVALIVGLGGAISDSPGASTGDMDAKTDTNRTPAWKLGARPTAWATPLGALTARNFDE